MAAMSNESWASDHETSYTPSEVSKEVSSAMGPAGERSMTWIRPLPRMPKFWEVATARRCS